MSNGGENNDVSRKSPAPATPNNTPQKKKSLPKPPDGGKYTNTNNFALCSTT